MDAVKITIARSRRCAAQATAALVLGAQAAQLGTAFLSCAESPIHPAWKEKIVRRLLTVLYQHHHELKQLWYQLDSVRPLISMKTSFVAPTA